MPRLPVGDVCPVCDYARSDVDPCIGARLSGVTGSCCGHGSVEDAYVRLDDRTPDGTDVVMLTGECALSYLRQRGCEA